MKRNISPSLLSANFANLTKDIKTVEDLGVTRLHLDVMDGHFVPNLTFGPFIISQIRATTKLHLETHLMIANAEKYLEDYAKAGSDTIIVHYEVSKNIKSDLRNIRKLGKKAGIAFNPDTDYKLIRPFYDDLDYILIMSVFPGFGGQKFIRDVLKKIEKISEIKHKKNFEFDIEVDGGINFSNFKEVLGAGANILVSGTTIFKENNGDIKKNINFLKTI